MLLLQANGEADGEADNYRASASAEEAALLAAEMDAAFGSGTLGSGSGAAGSERGRPLPQPGDESALPLPSRPSCGVTASLADEGLDGSLGGAPSLQGEAGEHHGHGGGHGRGHGGGKATLSAARPQDAYRDVALNVAATGAVEVRGAEASSDFPLVGMHLAACLSAAALLSFSLPPSPCPSPLPPP